MWDGQAKHSCLCRTIQTETVCESSPASPKEPRAARAAWCRIPKPPTPLAQCSPAGTGLRAPPAPRVPGGEGLKMQEHLQQPYASKGIPFPSGCTKPVIMGRSRSQVPGGAPRSCFCAAGPRRKDQSLLCYLVLLSLEAARWAGLSRLVWPQSSADSGRRELTR